VAAGPMAAECTVDTSAALGRTGVADTGTTIGAAVRATVTDIGTTDHTGTPTEGPAGDGHPRAVSGYAAAAVGMAHPTGTAIIEEEDGVTAVGMAVGHTVVVGATSAERWRQPTLRSLSGTRCRRGTVLFDLRQAAYRPERRILQMNPVPRELDCS
jgi:hypothetical protein